METAYLHGQLASGPRPTPTFGSNGFRDLSEEAGGSGLPNLDVSNPHHCLLMTMQQDGEIRTILREFVRLGRLAAEREIALELINAAMGQKM